MRQRLLLVNNLIPSPIDCAREAVTTPYSHFDNREDGVKDKVGYLMIERIRHIIASDVCLVLNQVDSRRRVHAGDCSIAIIL